MLENCEFNLQEVEFLGHNVSPQGIQMDPKKIEAVLTWQKPQNHKDVLRFLSFANYYGLLIPVYADITTPLTYLLQLKELFLWTPEADHAFTILKTHFTTKPILRYPDP
ncbi:uncharacterized protein LOC144587159 [Pogona vitticeps]